MRRSIRVLSGISLGAVAAALVALPGAGEHGAAPTPGMAAKGLKSFEGIEEPKVKYVVAKDSFEPDDFTNITDAEDGAVRMTLRYHAGDWWDGDRTTKSRDRQRAEVKGLGPHQKEGETFEYATTWRTDPNFRAGNRFCHVFQLKATNGDNGAPLVTLSILPGAGRAAVRYWPGDSKGFLMARPFSWKPNTWQSVRIRITTSTKKEGAIQVSVDGDPFQGVQNVSVFRPDATDYRPKWGLYRGVAKDMPFGDDWIEHRNVMAQKL